MKNPLQEFKLYIEGDKVEFITDEEKNRFKKLVTHYKSRTKKRTELKMIVKRWRSGRTSGQAHEKSNQNGYYYGGIINTLINSDPFIGHSMEDMNYGLKCNFSRIGGSDAYPKTKSFADYNAKEFEDKMEEIRIWALRDYGIRIQTVGEYYNIEKE